MSSQTKPMMAAGMGLATAAAIVASAIALPVSHGLATASLPSLSSAFTLMDSEHGNGEDHGNWSNNLSNSGSGSHSESESESESDHHGGFGNIFGFVGNFLTNNQAAVEAFAAGVPTFYVGPVAVGQGVLASAFYTGYNGSATGLPGVLAYVTSQIGNVTEFIKNAVLTVTHLVPVINLGPLAVGGGLLANAFFDGYNGSATGVAGIISYVTASLGLQAAPAAAAKTVAGSAAASLPKAAATTVTVATPATAAAAAATRRVAKSAAAAPRSAAKAASAKAAPKAAAASRRAK
ncbi:MAG: hypothetical protein ACOYBX_12770 [Mycobacterium sp.]